MKEMLSHTHVSIYTLKVEFHNNRPSLIVIPSKLADNKNNSKYIMKFLKHTQFKKQKIIWTLSSVFVQAQEMVSLFFFI
jgi:hypothetical protein